MIKINDKEVTRAVEKTLKYIKKKAPAFVEKLGISINTSIKKRVQQDGQGVSGFMPPYTPKYRAWKKGKGRKVAKRDLTFSSKMWTALTVEQTDTKTRMFFSGKEEEKKAKGNQAIADFFGIANTEQVVIDKSLKRLLKEVM